MYARDHFTTVEGLRDVVGRAQAESTDSLGSFIQRRQEDDRYVGGGGIAL